MELRRRWAVVLRWWWLLLLGTFLAGGAGYCASQLQPKVYRATAVLLVNQAQGTQGLDYSSLMLSQQLTATYAELLTKPPVLTAAIQRLGLPLDAAGLAELVDVRVVRNTQLLEVSAEHQSPEVARDIANAVAESFIDQRLADQLGRNASSRQAIRDQISSLRGEIARTSQALDRAREESQPGFRSAPPVDSGEVTRLQGLLSQLQVTYSELLRDDGELSLREAQVANSIKLVAPAEVPREPIRPKALQNTALAAVVGLLLALGGVLVVEYLDDTVKTDSDVREVAGLPTLAVVARAHHRRGQGPLLFDDAARQPALAEAYRKLRVSLDFAWAGEPGRVVMVTSANPGEGKSTTVANLAVALAREGRRVVAADADLRRPSLHRAFGVAGERGLANLLSDPALSAADCLAETGREGLWLLPCGPVPPNPAELLGSPRLAVALGELRERADVILVDTPPALGVVDPAVVASRVDGMVLVVEGGATRREALSRACEGLAPTGARPLGVVLNKVHERRAGHYYDYYRRYYPDGAASPHVHVDDLPSRTVKR